MSQNKVPSRPTIHWKQTQGNRYNQKMHPAMLTEYGCRELRNITLKGNKRGGSKKEWVDVHYDTEYVIQKVIVEVFKPLLITEHLQMKRILSLAWKQYTVQCLNKEDKPFY